MESDQVQGSTTTVPGMRTRPRAGVPVATFKALEETGARQKNDPTVGFETPPHGTSGLPVTLTELLTMPLSVKHTRFFAMQVSPATHTGQVGEG